MLIWASPRSLARKATPPERWAMKRAVAGVICISPSARAEPRLRVDDGGDERGVEVLLLGLLADDVLVAQRQGDLSHRLLPQRQEQQRPYAGDDENAGQERQPSAATDLRAHA